MKILRYFLMILFFAAIISKTIAQENKPTDQKTYIKVPVGYLMVLRQGDDILAKIEELATKENIPSANFSAMGFVDIKFGFFNFDTKEYDPKEFKAVELASMTGSIAWQKGKVSLHTHGVITEKDFTAHGGHVLSATVSTGSLEILVTVHDKKLERVVEQPLGANVLNLGKE